MNTPSISSLAVFIAFGCFSAFADDRDNSRFDLNREFHMTLGAAPLPDQDLSRAHTKLAEPQLAVVAGKLYYRFQEGDTVTHKEVPSELYGGRVPRGATPRVFNGEIYFVTPLQ